MKRRKALALLLSLVLVIGLFPTAALADDAGGGDGQDTYVLMNIPYAAFYAAELGENGVDAISSATLNGKARNVNVNGASYHQSKAAVTEEGIIGTTYPVRASAEDLAALRELGAKEVTDADKISYTMNVRGTETEMTLEGPKALQEAPTYSYYVLKDAPASYKELTLTDGAVSFGPAVGAQAAGEVTGEVTVGGRHADIEIALSGVDVNAADVSGVIVTTAEGSYALHHVVNIWRGTEIGWNLSDMDLGGQTITGIAYYLKDGAVQTYSADIAIAEAGYVLMNVPYADFYAAELGESGSVDAVSGATLKYANKGIAGGSYHVTDAADASSQVEAIGVTYPVFVTDLSMLDPSLEVQADAVKTIGLVTGREKTITPTEVTGQDTLFCAPSYSWMKLADKPARYKALTAAEDGAFSFGAVSGRASSVADVTGRASYYTHHGNYTEIRLDGITIQEDVSGVLVTFDDGSVMALPHVQDFWQKTQLGWSAPDAVAGKTITNVRFITADAVYDCAVEIPVKLPCGEITAAFEDANNLTVTGLPEDIANPVATVQTQVGRGETPTVIAEKAAVKDGKVVTTDAAVDGTAYTVNVTSDNYADRSASATYALPAGESFLSKVIGEYQPLFEGATLKSEYDHYWHDYTAAVVGASAADDTVAYMKSTINAQGYGETAEPSSFFCGFVNDVATITFGGQDGKTVTFNKTDGSSVTHTYAFVKEAAATGKYGDADMAMDGYLYQAQDGPEDEFRYLLMFPDTPETTFHLEFRYADTEENVEKLLDGPYANWVGSAIQTSALQEKNEDTLQNVISLFVVENLAEMTNEETNAQRAGLAGTWDCDFSAFPEYGNAEMYIVLSADGQGKTYADFTGSGNPEQVSEYTFFAYDPDPSDGKDAGTYIALNPDAETVTPGQYEITAVNGKKALVFTSNEGVITYILREEQSSGGGGRSGGSRGGGTASVSASYAVTVASSENGAVTASARTAAAGGKVTLTVKPDESYRLDKLTVADKNGTVVAVTAQSDGTWTFTMPAADVTVTGTFTNEPASADKGCAKDSTCPISQFSDSSPAAWYHDGVHWALDEGIMNGTGAGTFTPGGETTRAMIVTMLWRMENQPKADAPASFRDVAANQWYTDAVAWAAQQEIVKGYDSDTFGPMDSVTREQLAAILYRYAQVKGLDVSADGDLSAFGDAASVSGWAADAMKWAAGKGIVSGKSASLLAPVDNASRAEVATMLMRFDAAAKD